MKDLFANLYNGNLLVRPSDPDEVLDLDGVRIELPASVRTARTTDGVILAAAPGYEDWVGMRVIFGQRAGQQVCLEGVKAQNVHLFLPASEVICFGRRKMEWIERCIPVPGHLLVERCEMPLTRGRIQLAAGARTNTRSNEAIVLAISPEAQERLPDVAVDDRVLLSQIAGRSIAFDFREIRVLVDLPVTAVIAKLSAVPEEALIAGEDPLRYYRDMTDSAEAVEPGFAEGDPTGVL